MDEAKDLMGVSEDVAIVSMGGLDPEAYALREIIFNETRLPVWEAAVKRYAPIRRLKGYCSYVKMLGDQEKLLAVSVLSPVDEVRRIAAAKLEDKGDLRARYESTSDEEERARILSLVDDDDGFVASKLSELSEEQVAHVFEIVEDRSAARRLVDHLPDDLTMVKAEARKRYCQLSTEAELLEILRDEAEDDPLKEAVITQLIAICVDSDRQNKKIGFKPGDAVIITRFAQMGDEGSDARTLLAFHRLCWKCGKKMELNGTYWNTYDRFDMVDNPHDETVGEDEPFLFFVDFYNTKRRMASYKCPDCGNQIEVQVEPWR
ncbi:MAG: hypothetical protein Q4A93_00665 [Actinomycetota bacterium]|nr:hypothetical protein [Actinomycetota bacterium]